VRRQAAMKSFAIPGGMTNFDIVLVFLGIVPASLNFVRLPRLISSAATRQGLSFCKSHAGTGFHTVFGLGEIFLGSLALRFRLRRRCAARQGDSNSHE